MGRTFRCDCPNRSGSITHLTHRICTLRLLQQRPWENWAGWFWKMDVPSGWGIWVEVFNLVFTEKKGKYIFLFLTNYFKSELLNSVLTTDPNQYNFSSCRSTKLISTFKKKKGQDSKHILKPDSCIKESD